MLSHDTLTKPELDWVWQQLFGESNKSAIADAYGHCGQLSSSVCVLTEANKHVCQLFNERMNSMFSFICVSVFLHVCVYLMDILDNYNGIW